MYDKCFHILSIFSLHWTRARYAIWTERHIFLLDSHPEVLSKRDTPPGIHKVKEGAVLPQILLNVSGAKNIINQVERQMTG